MDFNEVDNLSGHRAKAQAWVAENVRPEWVEQQHQAGDHHVQELHEKLGADGYLGAGWPKEYGGTDVDPMLAQAVFEEIGGAGLRMDGWVTTDMVTRTILATATEELKSEVIPGVLRGEIVIVLGYTEPGSGSDAAAASLRAKPTADSGWILNGSKMFTSTAHLGTHVFLLTRTNTEVPKHKGLTMFLVPLSSPGVEVKPVHTLGGQRTNATYYTDVRIPDSVRVGEVDGGWNVMRVALVYERGIGVPSAGASLAERVAAWARTADDGTGQKVFDDPSVKEHLARIAVDDELSRLLGLRVRWVHATGGMPGVEGSMQKLFSSEASQRHHPVLLDIIGPAAVLNEWSEDAPLAGAVETAFRNNPVSTIYGGASEVMRDIIAERRLGLPRSRPSG